MQQLFGRKVHAPPPAHHRFMQLAALRKVAYSCHLAAMSGVSQAPLVLIVDDFVDIREAYGDFLRYRGYRVAEASDGAQAVVQAQALLPDVVLMDLSLPGMDGWEATRRLKADPRTRAIRVVALTGHALAGVAESAHDAGCDSFLTKPCLPQDVVAEVRRVLGLESDPKLAVRAG
jgi:CheY-like chemotaxis protein